ELGVERRRQARVIGRLEVVAALDQRVEVPAGEEEPGERLRARVYGEIARARRRGEPRERLEAARAADWRKGVAARPAPFARAPAAVPPQGAGVARGPLRAVARDQGILEVVGPGEIAVGREAKRQAEP